MSREVVDMLDHRAANAGSRVARDKVRRRARSVLSRAVLYLVLCAGSVLFLMPLAWMISTSLKTPEQYFGFPPRWIPNPIYWKNYVEGLTYFPFIRYTLNTLFITCVSIVGVAMSSSITAYSFARLRWPGRDVFFVAFLATLMLPGQVTMIPIYVLFTRLGWVDTYLPLTVPYFFGGAFWVFLLRQFFLSIPFDLSDAAKIDGCSEFAIYWRIMLPLSKPALATVAIFTFIGVWNDFMGPLIYLNSPEKYTLALGLRSFQ
ncbi:MAG: carbohydrate ABC transporter permease, partial [Bacillota bacterium]